MTRYAPKPIWLLTYEGANDVVNELGAHITSVEYTDNLAGKSDEISITLANDDLRFVKGWYPSAGDRVDVKMGYEGSPLIPCGRFKVGLIEESIGPNTVTIHGLAAGIGAQVRTKQSRAFEETTLRDVADILCRELHLELEGDIADISLGRVSMDQETTLAFLRRLAEEYGYAFSIRDSERVTFYEIAKLEKSPPVLTLTRGDFKPGVHFSSEIMNTYIACEVTFLDPATAKTMKVRVDEERAREVLIINASKPVAEGVPVIPTRTLRDGVKGDDVRGWQTFLGQSGFDPGPVDGVFGAKTRAATIAFQRAGGIAQDGIAGPETFRVAVGQGFDLRALNATPTTHTEPAGNVLRETIRVESIEQAELKARALLRAKNRLKSKGTIPLLGNTRVMAGVTIDIDDDWGRLTGRYLVKSSKHRMTKSGSYETSAEVQSVAVA